MLASPLEPVANEIDRVSGHPTTAKPGERSMTQPHREEPIDEAVLEGLHRLHREGRPDIAKTVIMLFLESAPAALRAWTIARESEVGNSQSLVNEITQNRVAVALKALASTPS